MAKKYTCYKVEDSIEDAKHEITSKVWYEEDFKDPSSKSWWDDEWKRGLTLQRTNPNKFRNWVRETIDYVESDFKEGHIKKEVLSELRTVLVNDSVDDSINDSQADVIKQIKRDISSIKDVTNMLINNLNKLSNNVQNGNLNDLNYVRSSINAVKSTMNYITSYYEIDIVNSIKRN